MSYQSIDKLTKDQDFIGRVTACATEQADTYKNDARPDFVSLSKDVLKGAAGPLMAFVRIAASGPGMGDKVDLGDGTIDQSQVTDEDLLTLTQDNWQVVAGLFYDSSTGAPI